jgi:glycosyltransferase involved in cell wall biosynthesis
MPPLAPVPASGAPGAVVVLGESAAVDAGVPKRLRMDVQALLASGERGVVVALDAPALADHPDFAAHPGRERLTLVPLEPAMEPADRVALRACRVARAAGAYAAVDEVAYWRALRRGAARALTALGDLPIGRVIGHDASFVLAAAPLCARRGIPLGFVVHALLAERASSGANPHGRLYTWARRAGERRAMQRATRTFPVSRSTAEACRAAGAPAERLRVLHNLVDTRGLPAPRTLAERDLDCVYVGRLAVEKGIDTMLAAFERLPPDVHLTVAGHGALAGAVAHAAERHPGRITFLGPRPYREVLDLFGRARLALVPSHSEPFGFVVLEAFSVGTPVVASATGGIEEIVEAGRGGLLTPPRDAARLAEAILQVRDDAALWRRLSTQALDRLDAFAFPARADEILAAYRFPDAPGAQ